MPRPINTRTFINALRRHIDSHAIDVEVETRRKKGSYTTLTFTDRRDGRTMTITLPDANISPGVQQNLIKFARQHHMADALAAVISFIALKSDPGAQVVGRFSGAPLLLQPGAAPAASPNLKASSPQIEDAEPSVTEIDRLARGESMTAARVQSLLGVARPLADAILGAEND